MMRFMVKQHTPESFRDEALAKMRNWAMEAELEGRITRFELNGEDWQIDTLEALRQIGRLPHDVDILSHKEAGTLAQLYRKAIT